METNKPKKIRLGSGKKRNQTWITASICLSEAHKHSYHYDGKEYVNININIAELPNEYGKDVQITLNDYKKESDLSSKV
jgi:hypothetical protein